MASWWLAKAGGGRRRMATLSPRDAAAWDRLGRSVAATVEPRLGSSVVGNRAQVPGSRRGLLPHRPALIRARRAAALLAGAARVLLRADVAAFYPSVTPAVLHRALHAVGVEPFDAREAADMLGGWGSEGYGGLPIGPEASAVMANAVLGHVDRAVAPFPFLRWVDDYLIAVPSDRAALEALDRLDAALARLGLTRNETKTSLIAPGSAFRWLGASLS